MLVDAAGSNRFEDARKSRFKEPIRTRTLAHSRLSFCGQAQGVTFPRAFVLRSSVLEGEK